MKRFTSRCLAIVAVMSMAACTDLTGPTEVADNGPEIQDRPLASCTSVNSSGTTC